MADAPELKAHPAYAAAFAEIMRRVAKALGPGRPHRPIVAAVAGGAALHFYTGGRISSDIDASLLARVLLDANDLRVAYNLPDGGPQVLSYDTQYNDSLALLHEDAYDDAIPLHVEGVDPRRLEVRLLAPLDLAVSKLSRFSAQDRVDIKALARERLVDGAHLRRPAEEAVPGYVGNLARIRTSLDIACRDVAAIAASRRARRPRKRRLDPLNALINAMAHANASREERVNYLAQEMLKTLPQGPIEIGGDNLFEKAKVVK